MNKDIEFIACSMRLKILIQAREDLIENINKYSTKSYEKILIIIKIRYDFRRCYKV
ncbi:hypothetical protein JMW52_14040 [Clostridioides difficile]|uniref:hypothetical protein n=1 Tax=Clostridioides difficile TaxID=1496 RepID=UPI001AF2E7D6|nr:hypothetical protein [Clostridioides difficile]QQY52559.1 hypothetical protein JMW52_14040 [Clostridioides difficile]